ncbi:MlaD family protein [Methylocaldum szegediense]|uniref:Phospholipid/cholesterol/gamma-HCH transport system substrate-binding protein n=1 Tax=Methylocaldum szegediense TaxID=73780 RepID=A0ABM9HX43_9GAMM|nr:MlaD family protein [Methylocaldum szegediense]CAI8745284.1 phospholipid/cholesterol/gamma-HCH transport system substrate-binding protein [Methylocaldum szegediense]
MGRESYAFLTGLFVVILGAASIIVALWLGNYGEEYNSYYVVTQGSVSGLNPESTVLYRGVNAGKVSSISFDPKDRRNILVRVELNKDLPITQGTYAKLRVQALTGLAQVELFDTGEQPEPLPTDPDNPARIPLRPSLFDKLTESGQDILTQLGILANRLNSLLNEGNRERIQRILESVAIAAEQLATLEESMDEMLAEVPALSGEAQRMMAGISRLTDELGTAVKEIRSLTKTTQDLVAAGNSASEVIVETTLPKINALLDETRSVATNIRDLSDMLRDDPRTLLFGPPKQVPGPGEPGFREPK